MSVFAGTELRRELDRVPLWRGDHVTVKQLAEDFASYLYLPRLKDSQVFLEAVRQGVNSLSWQADTFAYAQAVDEDGRFRDLCAGHAETSILLNDESVLVKAEAASRQLAADASAAQEFSDQGGRIFTPAGDQPPLGGDNLGDGDAAAVTTVAPPTEKVVRRFWGNIELDPNRLNKQVPEVVAHVVEHLNRLAGANVRVRLEIEADVPGGVPGKTVMDVTENVRTLKFEGFGFEEE